MSKPLKPRRGTTAEHAAFIGQAHEVTYDTDKHTLVMHDGVTPGGFPLLRADQQALIDAAQDAALTAATQTETEHHNSSLVSATIDGLDLVLTYGDGSEKRVPLPTGKGVGDMWFGVDPKSKPANVQAYSGQLLSRASYIDHWAFVNGGNRTVISESEWQAQVSADGFCPFYSSGDGSTTYRMPMVKDVHPKFVAALAEAGVYTEAAAPNITGTFAAEARLGSSAPKGAFYYTGKTTEGAVGGGTDHIVGLDASRSSSVYRDDCDTIQPPAVNVLLGEYVVSTVAPIGEADATSLLASVTHLETVKMDGDAIGPWVYSYLEASSTVTLGTYPIDLSSYLPSDGANYEVLVRMYVSRPSDSSGSNSVLRIFAFGQSVNTLLQTEADGLNWQQGHVAGLVPVGADRTITFEISGYQPTVATLFINAYRKVI